MFERVRLENCLKIYSLAEFPRAHPLAETIEVRMGWGSMKESSYLPANCVFRAIHDWYGHIEPSYSFDAEGEECAYRRHYAMFTGDARLYRHDGGCMGPDGRLLEERGFTVSILGELLPETETTFARKVREAFSQEEVVLVRATGEAEFIGE